MVTCDAEFDSSTIYQTTSLLGASCSPANRAGQALSTGSEVSSRTRSILQRWFPTLSEGCDTCWDLQKVGASAYKARHSLSRLSCFTCSLSLPEPCHFFIIPILGNSSRLWKWSISLNPKIFFNTVCQRTDFRNTAVGFLKHWMVEGRSAFLICCYVIKPSKPLRSSGNRSALCPRSQN